MIESLHAHQIERVLELGAWRDQGRLFAVGLNGEVFKYEPEKVSPDERRQRQGAAASAPSSAPASSAAPATSGAQSAGEERRAALRAVNLKHLQHVREYYPSLISRETEDGLWVIVKSYPLGCDGPRFWICLFLPDWDHFDSKAFAFSEISLAPRPVGLRHTNFPDASICSFTADDDAWRPGDSPLALLNLHSEWLLCHLHFAIKDLWPGRQFGPDAVYRHLEFKPEEWCFCASGKRYGNCHQPLDTAEVNFLRLIGKPIELDERSVPPGVTRFAKTQWEDVPPSKEITLFLYSGKPPRFLESQCTV